MNLMAPMPSAVRGNLAASSQQFLSRPPSFEVFFKTTKNTQQKPLKIERKFSHYEQKVASAPIERCNKKIPRRLQTRKVTRHAKSFDEDKIHWNERLAAWLQEDQSRSVEYIKISDQFNIIEKQLYYCSACHEYFHLNLKEREGKRIGCPRFRDHHEPHVRPVTITKTKKPRNKRPRIVPKDPFGDRSKLLVPSLLPPKPMKRPVRVVVDVPRLPPISKATTSRTSSILPIPKSQSASRKHFVSPASTSPGEATPTIINEKVSYTPVKLPKIASPDVETETSQNTPEPEELSEPDSEEQEEAEAPVPITVTIRQPEEPNEPIEEQEIEPEENECGDLSPNEIGNGVAARSPSVGRRKGVSFNDFKLNDILECSDVESMERDVDSAERDEFNFDAGSDDEEGNFSDEPDLEDELEIPSPMLEYPPSPLHVRPRPPPPDLPTFQLAESPEFEPTIKKKPPLKKRQAVFLPPIKKEPKPEPKKPQKSAKKRMTSDELAKRMKRAKAVEGYRRKYEFQGEEYDGTTDDSASVTSEELDAYEDSFLEKYCLVSKEHFRKCKRVFNKFDYDADGLLKSEEVVNAIHKMFSPKVLDDVEMCYIFRILETTSYDIFTEKMNLKLFSIVVALAEKISQLDENMKHLIGRVNVEVVDWKLCRARKLFEATMRRDATGVYKVPMEALWLEMHAGGISEKHEKQARKALSHMKEMDLLDFLSYLPLFLLVHSKVVANPLNWDRHD